LLWAGERSHAIPPPCRGETGAPTDYFGSTVTFSILPVNLTGTS
jgi:hypothetical protein